LKLVSEISEKLYLKELTYLGIGGIVFLVILFIPIRKLLWLVPFLYWGNVLLLGLVDLIGVSKLGARRWLEIPFTPFTIQPSEFMKTTLLLMLGYLIYRYPPRPYYRLGEFLRLSVYILVPFFLIAKEPDLGTALIILLVGMGVLFIVGVDKRVWIGLGVATLIIVPVGYKYFLKDYQRKRIEAFIHKPSYHVRQSLIAIGSGGITGKSVQDATQTQLKFLPIASSDFIFAYFAERFGFVGAVGLILLYFAFITYLLLRAERFKEDYLAKVMFAGVALLLFVYSFVNIGMTIKMAPVVGIPLPMVSYGGTSFLTFVVLIAILENLVARGDFLHSYGVK
jgi:rod shape determining protein RodA